MTQRPRDQPPGDLDIHEYVRLSGSAQRSRQKRSRLVKLAIGVSVGLAIMLLVPYGVIIVFVVAGLTAPAWSGWWRR